MEHLVLHVKGLRGNRNVIHKRTMNFLWIDTISNERVLTIANIKCELLQTIKKMENDIFRACDEKRQHRKSIANRKVNGKESEGDRG